MTAALALLAAILLLHAADVATTAIALRRGFTEVNPIARKLFGGLGVLEGAIALKLIGTAPMALLCLSYPRWWPVPALYAASLAWVVAHNLRALRRAAGGS